jgi:hypothetical protein
MFRNANESRNFEMKSTPIRIALELTLIFAVPFVSIDASAAVSKATLTLPSEVIERNGNVPVTFRFEHGLTGEGKLKVRWTDSLGRIVEDNVRPVALRDEIEFSFFIDSSRAVAMKNTLHATITLEEKTAKGVQKTEEDATIDFIAKPASDGWTDYNIMMYQNYPSAIQPALEQLGINGGKYEGRNLAPPDYLIDNNMRWYSENLATDFYAEYHRWRSDRPYDWSLDQAKALYAKDPSSKEAFKRHPSFWDTEWRTRTHDRIVDATRRNSPYQPFFYSLSDETGIASLGSGWDFDFSDQSIVPMRRWLRSQYSTLTDLNKEWDTDFTDWDHVTPLSTNEAMQRQGENFAPWADFKEWMDISFADALKMGVDAVHEIDPHALAGIVGAQKPGWGGYDYSRLTRSVGVMEPYDIGGSVKLAHSLNPDIPLLSTSFASGDWEKHRVWFELLQGERGIILWDESQRYILPDGSKGPAGKSAEQYYNELRDGAGALIINSVAHDDGIAVHYSQPSMRTEWMLERRPDGIAWMNRDASYERSHNQFLRLRESWGHAIEDQGLQYSYLSYTQVEEGQLLRHGYHALVLPRSSSLSEKEAENIREFARSGGVVIADGMPGTFDEHSRRLGTSLLADLFSGEHTQPLTIKPYGAGKTIFVNTNTLDYLQDRITGKEGSTYKVIADLFKTSGIHPEIPTTDEHDNSIVGINVHVFSNGAVRLLSLQSNPQQSVDELGPPNFHSNKRFEISKTVQIHLPTRMYVYDVRKKKFLGDQQTLSVAVDPYEPTILSLTSTPPPHLEISVPSEAAAGIVVPVALRLPQTLSAFQVYHVDVLDPSGKRLLQYSGNVIARGESAVKLIPLAKNDAPGAWTIRVQDMLTGNIETRTLNVR